MVTTKNITKNCLQRRKSKYYTRKNKTQKKKGLEEFRNVKNIRHKENKQQNVRSNFTLSVNNLNVNELTLQLKKD